MKIIYLCNQYTFVRQEKLSHNAYGISERDNISSRDPHQGPTFLFYAISIEYPHFQQLMNYQLQLIPLVTLRVIDLDLYRLMLAIPHLHFFCYTLAYFVTDVENTFVLEYLVMMCNCRGLPDLLNCHE